MADAPATKKVSRIESGHAKNAANFGLLYTVVEGIGAAYNPSVSTLTIASLKTLRQNVDKTLSAVSAAEAPFKIAVSKRQEAFDGMSKLATRVVNALSIAGSEREIKAAKSILKKIRGERAIKPEDPAKAAKTKSSSQMSYDNRVNNFKELTALLGAVPAYKPNEADLKVAALNKYLDALPALGEAVNKAAVALSKARADRDNLLYAKGVGAVDIGLKVKKYVKSVFGASSPQYKKVSKIALKQY